MVDMHLPDSTEPLLPTTFAFSQSSLQAYADCPRRFWLAYVQQLPWPAVEAAPVEQYEQAMRRGGRFHRLVERSEIGMDTAQMAAGLTPPLSTWYDAYLRFRPDDLPTAFVDVESVLSIPFGPDGQRYRLAAKYDLIAADEDGRVVIVDWKTTSRRTDPATLSRRLQSVVYPFVLVEASATLPWGPVTPDQVEMRYWFTTEPSRPVTFRYDGAQHDANRARLDALLAQILAGRTEADFPKVPDTEQNRRRLCAFCIYRSRCNRGVDAGDLDDVDDMDELFVVDLEAALEFTLDDIDELAF